MKTYLYNSFANNSYIDVFLIMWIGYFIVALILSIHETMTDTDFNLKIQHDGKGMLGIFTALVTILMLLLSALASAVFTAFFYVLG